MYPFEIHLTTGALLPVELANFVAACTHLRAKPLVIELARGAHPIQPMFSKTVQAPDLPAALTLAAADAEYLANCQLLITRTKLETRLEYQPLALSTNGPAFIPYFEWHGKVPYQHVPDLLALCQQHRAHLSANALRGAGATRFVTLREFNSAATFRARIASLVASLQTRWPLLKQETECCLYDSNRALDAGWLTP